jgi:hypothetical protein
MVKFVEGDHSYDIVVNKLLDICKHDRLDTAPRNLKDLPFETVDPDMAPKKTQPGRPKEWSHDGAVT